MEFGKGLLGASLAAGLTLGWAGVNSFGAEEKGAVPPVTRWRGVNDAGAEFGTRSDFSNANPGQYDRDYHYSGIQTLRYFSARGFNMVRTPFRWERLQPQLGQELDAVELARLRAYLGRAAQAGIGVLLDPHNYGRYRLQEPGGKVVTAVIDQHPLVTRQQFAGFWRRVAAALQDEPALWGYGLCNEPHDMGQSDWKLISQAAVDAIRTIDRRRPILVPGDSWSNADRWPRVNGPTAWIRDPTGRIAYEAHLYLDSDYSGAYHMSYEDELRKDPTLPQRGSRRLQPFVEWCRANRVSGFIGEFGVPDTDPRWLDAMAEMVRAAQEAKLGWCYWAAGEWWGGYPLSIQPRDGQDRPQFKALRPFLEGLP